jgi:hypothetical protein
MKNEALYPGTEIQAQVPLHCLLAPFNNKKFNQEIYMEMEHNLCRYFNQYWSADSSHPILFYEGAWKQPYQKVIPANIKTELNTLPTLLIIPEIKEEGGIRFRVSLWGIPGFEEFKDSEYIPAGIKYDYRQEQKSITPEERQQILDELCPSLKAFISYVADQYYWAFDKVQPLLPSLLSRKIISLWNREEMDEYRKQYMAMFDRYVVKDTEINRMNMLTQPEKSLELCEGIKEMVKKEDFMQMIELSLHSLHHARVGYNNKQGTTSTILSDIPFRRDDILFLSKLSIYKADFETTIRSIIDDLQKNVPCEIFEIEKITLMDIFEWGNDKKNMFRNAKRFQVEIQDNCIISAFVDDNGNILSVNNIGMGIFYFQLISLPDTIKIENNPFTIEISKFNNMFNLINNMYGTAI